MPVHKIIWKPTDTFCCFTTFQWFTQLEQLKNFITFFWFEPSWKQSHRKWCHWWRHYISFGTFKLMKKNIYFNMITISFNILTIGDVLSNWYYYTPCVTICVFVWLNIIVLLICFQKRKAALQSTIPRSPFALTPPNSSTTWQQSTTMYMWTDLAL